MCILKNYNHCNHFVTCIEPCENGYERSTEGVCEECDLGTYRTAITSHMCLACDIGKTTQNPGADTDSMCIRKL